MTTKSNFLRPESLYEWLKTRIPTDDLKSWGEKAGTKTIHNLWLELSEGECFLDDSTTPPCRTVSCVVVRIRGPVDGKILLESHQELSDGTVRKRGRPLAEKMKAGESVDAAIIRAIKEELGSILPANVNVADVVKVVSGSHQMNVNKRASESYPGLPALYHAHIVDAYVEGLPDGDFCTVEEEYADCEAAASSGGRVVTVKKHFWTWGAPPVDVLAA